MGVRIRLRELSVNGGSTVREFLAPVDLEMRVQIRLREMSVNRGSTVHVLLDRIDEQHKHKATG